MGEPFASHVDLVDGPEGPIAFDAGVKDCGEQILAAAGRVVGDTQELWRALGKLDVQP